MISDCPSITHFLPKDVVRVSVAQNEYKVYVSSLEKSCCEKET